LIDDVKQIIDDDPFCSEQRKGQRPRVHHAVIKRILTQDLGAPTHPVPVTPEDIILAPDEDMAAILEEIVTALDDDPNDPNFVQVIIPRDQCLAAFHDMRDLHLEHLNGRGPAIVTAWFDQARPDPQLSFRHPE
jgi:hypothetical protein